MNDAARSVISVEVGVSIYFGHILGLTKEYEPVHKISNNVVCVTSKGSDQLAHMCSLIRAFVSFLNVL